MGAPQYIRRPVPAVMTSAVVMRAILLHTASVFNRWTLGKCFASIVHMPSQNIQAYKTRIIQIACGLLFVGAFMIALRSMMAGSFSRAALLVALMIGTALVFLLDDRYWLLCPFLAISDISVPRLPFNGIELGCVVLIGVYFCRLALKKGSAFHFGRDLVVTIPVVMWMFIVWMINPTGLAMFGSSSIGGRFYFEIAIAFMALLVLSTIRPDEKDAKFLFYILLSAMLWKLLDGVVFPKTDPDAIVFSGAEPERSARYAFVVCADIFMLLFALFSLSSVLSSPLKIPLFAALALLTIYSGKRRSFGTVALIPFFRAFLTKKERLLTAAMTIVAAVLLVFLVAGDGTAYSLPRSAKRTLAVLFPQYRVHDEGGIRDLFRREMREQARLVIRADPWFGRKGFAMNLDETVWMNFGHGYTGMYAGHAYSGNWHSTWYSYAADFGVPCLVFWCIFQMYYLWYALKACRLVVSGRYLPACCIYFSLSCFLAFTFSYTTGHSAVTTLEEWVKYGLLIAIVRGYRKQERLPGP